MKSIFKKSYNRWKENECLPENRPYKILWDCNVYDTTFLMGYLDEDRRMTICSLYSHGNGYDIYHIEEDRRTKKSRK